MTLIQSQHTVHYDLNITATNEKIEFAHAKDRNSGQFTPTSRAYN